MDDPGDKLKRALVYIMLGLFTVGVITAGALTHGFFGPPRPDGMPAFVEKTLIAVNGTLSVNLGLYLGLRSAIRGWDQEPIGSLQKAASWAYVVNLLLAVAFWAFTGFTEDATRVAPLLPAIVTAGVGIMLAFFGAALGVGTKRLTQGSLG
jgi:hypothetical protein